MKFVFVVGGSYKRFYINDLSQSVGADLVLFNQNIFYEIDNIKHISKSIVGKELLELNHKLNCPIVVYGIVNQNGVKHKRFVVCINGKVSLIKYNKAYLNINNKIVLITNQIYDNSQANVLICMNDNDIKYEKLKNNTNHYFICTKRGVQYLNKGKIYTKFRKCCNFVLRF
ncbi:MAG: hypothetical protein ACLRFE_00240 [Clostridia bacterium]